MSDQTNACDEVARIYEEKRAQGLRDVKFLLKNREEASFSEVCADLVAFNEAIAAEKTKKSDFGDLRLKS